MIATSQQSEPSIPPTYHLSSGERAGGPRDRNSEGGFAHSAAPRPGSPHRSPDVSILFAWMRAEMARPAPACISPRPAFDMPGGVERCDACAACKRHRRDIVTAVESAVRNAETVDARRVLGKYYYRLPGRIRGLLGRPRDAGLKELLGRWVKWQRDEQEQLTAAVLAGVETNPETGWIAGLAGLSEREAQAYWPRIRGQSRLDIARELTPAEDQRDRSRWVSLKTVSNLCWQAKVKVLKAFGLPPSGDPDEEWNTEAEADV